MIRVAALAVALTMAGPVLAASEVNLASPDERIQFRLFSTEDGQLQYSVAFRGKPAIEASAVGIVVDGVNLGDGAEIGEAESYTVDETYPWNGAKSTVVNKCNGLKIAMTHQESSTEYTVEVRAYDDGIAFRHIVPGEGSRVPDEATEFRFDPAGHIFWHNLDESYENFYQRKLIGIRPGQYATIPAGSWVAPPATIMLPENNGYVSITEGGLRHYSGMVLQADGEGGLIARLGHDAPASWQFLAYRTQFSAEEFAKPAAITGTITQPWRIAIIAADLNDLANCDIVHNVADPPDSKLFPEGIKTAWVKPGRSSWMYMDGGTNTPEGQKRFLDLTQQLGFEYDVIEGVWSRWPEEQLKEVSDYARERGIRILLWRHSGQLTNEKSIRELFDICRRNGAAGVKIDFFDHEHKQVIDQYELILQLAAEYHLLVDFHGSNKPTGLERTYPNLVGVEAVRGMEKELLARHDVTLPFTRLLAGLADYTPTNFNPRWMADTTWAHQVANAVILQAPLLVYIAHPANLLGNPTADMIKSIPSTWDETVVLPVSEIGEVAAIARRKGTTWFLAVNNGPIAKSVHIDLSFLAQDSGERGFSSRGSSYTATTIRDGMDASSVRIDHVSMSSTESIDLNLRSGGGFVARFEK